MTGVVDPSQQIMSFGTRYTGSRTAAPTKRVDPTSCWTALSGGIALAASAGFFPNVCQAKRSSGVFPVKKFRIDKVL